MSEKRKIAAILASDIVGFSRLAGADEDRILARLRTLRSDVIDPTIAVHNGRVVKRTGDGSIVEFRSVVDAVRCAIEVQNAMLERNSGVPEDRRIVFRIGIHLGDVVEESDGDLMGDGVNIAARLESFAAPGTICLSEDAYRQVSARLDMAVTDLGPTQLKNIDRSIRAYSLRVGVPAEPKLATPTKLVAPTRRSRTPAVVAIVALFLVVAGVGWWFLVKPVSSAKAAHLSIVVLPFANLSGDAAQDYFADGVTENLTTDLSNIKGSFVIARNTAYAFKGKSIDARDIGKQLGVRYVLEGSVQRDQNRVRVNAQLIDAETGAHLWADRFESDIVDLFKLQDDVVARLANSLGNELVKAEAQNSVRKVNPDVMDIAMRGQSRLFLFQQQPTKENLHAARVLFEQALQIDSDDANALAGDAFTYAMDFAYGWSNSETDYSEKIIAQADRAIALAPHNRWAYVAKTNYLVGIHRASEALAVAEAGLVTNPNSADLVGGARGNAKLWLGKYESAIADERQALLLSPLDPEVGIWHFFIGDAELGLRHLDASIDENQKAVSAGFRAFFTYRDLAAAFALQGKSTEATAALADMRRQNPNLTIKVVVAISPNMPPLFEGLRKAGLPEE